MSEKYRVVIEVYSSSSPNKVTRKVIDEKDIKPVESICDLGLRHKEQIDLLEKVQQQILNQQSKYLREDIDFCPKCGCKVIKRGHDASNFHAVFTDHKVKTQRLKCTKCTWKSIPSVKSLLGTSIHPDLAKIQAELGASHSYRDSEKILDLQSASKREINNHDRVKHIVEIVGNEIEVRNNLIQDEMIKVTPAANLIIQVDGGHIRSIEADERSFEVLTSIIYKPESVEKIRDTNRGNIRNKNCAASALSDNQESIKRNTLIAAKKQGLNEATCLTALCDGARNCWNVVEYLEPHCGQVTRILDWFHIAMKFKNISLPEKFREKLDKAKWHLWNANVDDAIKQLSFLVEELDKKYHDRIKKLINYIDNNSNYIVNYNQRYNDKLVFTSNIAESNVESLINQRCKRQQHMIWSRAGVQPLLQVRAAINSNDWLDKWETTILSGLKKAA